MRKNAKLCLISLLILAGINQVNAANFEGYYPYDIHGIYIQGDLKWFITSVSIQCYNERKRTLQAYPYPKEACIWRGEGMLHPRVAYKDGNLWIRNQGNNKDWDVCFSLSKRKLIDFKSLPRPQWKDTLYYVSNSEYKLTQKEELKKKAAYQEKLLKEFNDKRIIQPDEMLGNCILEDDLLWCGIITKDRRCKKFVKYNVNNGAVKIFPNKIANEGFLKYFSGSDVSDEIFLSFAQNGKVFGYFSPHIHDATFTGLCEFDQTTEKWRPVLDESINSGAFEGNIKWIGTRNGVFRIGNTIERITYNGQSLKSTSRQE